MIFICILKFLILFGFCQPMTMKQYKNTGRLMRKTCQPKNNVEDEKINCLNDGVFIEEPNVKCYVACLMKMANLVKNGKFSYESTMRQVDVILPPEIKEPYRATILACKTVTEPYDDVCDASFFMSKCMYEQNPSVFYMP